MEGSGSGIKRRQEDREASNDRNERGTEVLELADREERIMHAYTGVETSRREEPMRVRERERERAHGRVSVSGSSLLHFKPKRGYSSGFRRADVLYYCSVEIAILRLHSGLRACMRRFPGQPPPLLHPLTLSSASSLTSSLWLHSQGNALEARIRFSRDS